MAGQGGGRSGRAAVDGGRAGQPGRARRRARAGVGWRVRTHWVRDPEEARSLFHLAMATQVITPSGTAALLAHAVGGQVYVCGRPVPPEVLGAMLAQH